MSVFESNLDDDTKKEILREKVEEQDQELQELTDKGVIPDYSKKTPTIFNGNGKRTNKLKTTKEDQEKKTKHEDSKRKAVTYKYCQMGKGELYEAVIINVLPSFIKYNNITGKIELVEKVEEKSRILRPPEKEEYPYTPYEFESREELEFFIQKAKEMTLDDLYKFSKGIFLLYVDQDEHIIILLAADSIWTYFQDLFPTTHYFECVGDNDVGKSSIGYTFEYTGYRVIKGIAISGANYYRILGTDEPGQCVIIEDEGDNISEDLDKVKILKSGYEYNGKTPKTNIQTRNQDQNWFKTYCYKMILAEKSLKESTKVKGLVDRTLSGHCRPGKVKCSIKEVVGQNINKSPKLQKLYDELLYFRKLMLCYRLIHYKDLLPEIETGLKNRDNELCHPLIQLFYNTNALKEIVETLEIFVKQRRERKGNSLEAALYPIIKEYVFSAEGLDHNKNTYQELKQKKKLIAIDYSNIWSFIITGEIEGYYDSNKKYQYETVNYGTLYNNSLSRFISDKFGAKLNKKSKGSVLEFDIEKLEKFENVYGSGKLEEDIKIEVKPNIIAEENEDEQQQNLKDNDESYDGYDGSDSFREEETIINESATSTSNNNVKTLTDGNNNAFQKPSEPSEPSEPSGNIKSLLFNNPLISESDLKDPYGYQYAPNIINNIGRSEHSDRWFCNNCTLINDKWSMMKHLCRFNKKSKKNKEDETKDV